MEFEKSKKNIYKTVMLIIVTAFLTFLITVLGMRELYLKELRSEIAIQYDNSQMQGNESIFSKMLNNKISMIRQVLEQTYLKEIPDNMDLLDSTISGYVAGLEDEYTEYYSKEEYEELMIDVNGNFVGIGIYMAQDRYGNTIILMPIENSPAEEADLRTGDVIVKVNGEECKEIDTSIIANKIKGEEGTTVELEILREEETITKTITRKKVQIGYIKSEVLENNIGYIKISDFGEDCGKKFEEKLKELEDKNINSLIVDVRNNGGGIVTEVEKIAEILMEANKIVMITTDKTGNEEVLKTQKSNKFEGKIVLLINETSASASEILAAALKDNEMATLVGTTTYGKGVMQQIFPISDGSALKVTIDEFLTPNKNKIDKEGVKPDIEIEDSVETEKDEQLEKAIEILKK